MGSLVGTLKKHAKRLGLTLEEYHSRVESGLKWCTGCKEWHARDQFASDVTRYDSLSAVCREFNNKRNRDKYTPVPENERLPMGPPRDHPRDGDKIQARHLVNKDVQLGWRPNPNDLYCSLCGHKGDDQRHEYHHHMGYGVFHHYDVIPLCVKCHHNEDRKTLDGALESERN